MIKEGQPRPLVLPAQERAPDVSPTAPAQERVAGMQRSAWRHPVVTRFGLERTLCFAGSKLDMLHTGMGGC